MIMLIDKTYYKNLKKYLKDDVIYQDYIKNKNIDISDFDRFCIDHCVDIQFALKECETLEMIKRELKKENISIDKIKKIISKGGDENEI